ncbi:E3 ubiquitin ligase BIG BROTHER-like [Olea europaea subsp. europaea]|uniref:E3 ubiquitin ligase BIG BROTHER-like n=1 Tax=Olea europaea subsp. europaea TaxID=158383 RepID=A0A8S0RTX5_OLEEU|nr:E3 ubiquitin ligase BIG BROTHER-like [Olea europaea subsp. europaea]
MMSNNEAHNHYLNGISPSEISVHFKEIYPEFGDLNVQEVLLQQESAYLSIQASGKAKVTTSDYGQTNNGSQFLAQESESQLALDEAFARSLELGDNFANLYNSEHGGNIAESTNSSPRETPARIVIQNTREDEIDPDTMNYEELLSLGDAVGQERKGLSDDLISRLPTFKYKAGFFSKKKKKEECVICCAEYKNRAKLITLPCAHQYHSACITRWLKLNKVRVIFVYLLILRIFYPFASA